MTILRGQSAPPGLEGGDVLGLVHYDTSG